MSRHHPALFRRACSLASVLAVVGCGPDAARGPLTPTAPSLSGSSTALPFHGTVEASQTAAYQPETNTALVHQEGTGTATHLGRFTFVSDFTLDLATLTGIEQSTLTAADGDVLTVRMTAQGTPSEDGSSLNTLESATITGGTGRFAGATGNFILRRVINQATHVSTGSFDGTISLGK